MCTMDKSTFRRITGAFMEKIHWENTNNIQTQSNGSLAEVEPPRFGKYPGYSQMFTRCVVTVATFSTTFERRVTLNNDQSKVQMQI